MRINTPMPQMKWDECHFAIGQNCKQKYSYTVFRRKTKIEKADSIERAVSCGWWKVVSGLRRIHLYVYKCGRSIAMKIIKYWIQYNVISLAMAASYPALPCPQQTHTNFTQLIAKNNQFCFRTPHTFSVFIWLLFHHIYRMCVFVCLSQSTFRLLFFILFSWLWVSVCALRIRLKGSLGDSDNANHRTNRSFSKMKHNRKVRLRMLYSKWARASMLRSVSICNIRCISK